MHLYMADVQTSQSRAKILGSPPNDPQPCPLGGLCMHPTQQPTWQSLKDLRRPPATAASALEALEELSRQSPKRPRTQTAHLADLPDGHVFIASDSDLDRPSRRKRRAQQAGVAGSDGYLLSSEQGDEDDNIGSSSEGDSASAQGAEFLTNTELSDEDSDADDGEEEGGDDDWAVGANQLDDGYPHGTDAMKLSTTRGARPLYSGVHPATQGSRHSTQQQQQQQTQQQPTLSALHYEVAAFAAACAPDDVFIRVVSTAVEQVQAAAVRLWPNARAVLFGSQASGLSLPGSDVDVVVLGADYDSQSRGSRDVHSVREVHRRKEWNSQALQQLVQEMKRMKCFSSCVLVRAKVPIIKAKMIPDPEGPVGSTQLSRKQRAAARRGGELCVDISIGATNGVAAVALAQQLVQSVPPLRPLVLVLKAFLREAGFNEVFSGGVSSYALLNMVTAHLQSEGLHAQVTQALGRSLSGGGPQVQTQTQQAANDDGGGEAKALCHGLEIAFLQRVREMSEVEGRMAGGGLDMGDLLASFFARYGTVLEAHREAVSVRRGGVCERQRVHGAHVSGIMTVEDPQMAGHNLCAGSFNWPVVRLLLRAALQRLSCAQDITANPCVAIPALLPPSSARHSPHSRRGSGTDAWPVVANVALLGPALRAHCDSHRKLKKRPRGMPVNVGQVAAVLKAVDSWKGWLNVTVRSAESASASPSCIPPMHRVSHSHPQAPPTQQPTEAELWASVQAQGSHRAPHSADPRAGSGAQQGMAHTAGQSGCSRGSGSWAEHLGTLFDVEGALQSPLRTGSAETRRGNAAGVAQPQPPSQHKRSAGVGVGVGPGSESVANNGGVQLSGPAGAKLTKREAAILARQERRQVQSQQQRMRDLEAKQRNQLPHPAEAPGGSCVPHPEFEAPVDPYMERLKELAESLPDMSKFFQMPVQKQHSLAARAIGLRKGDHVAVANGAAGTKAEVELLAAQQFIQFRGYDRDLLTDPLVLEQARLNWLSKRQQGIAMQSANARARAKEQKRAREQAAAGGPAAAGAGAGAAAHQRAQGMQPVGTGAGQGQDASGRRQAGKQKPKKNKSRKGEVGGVKSAWKKGGQAGSPGGGGGGGGGIPARKRTRGQLRREGSNKKTGGGGQGGGGGGGRGGWVMG